MDLNEFNKIPLNVEGYTDEETRKRLEAEKERWAQSAIEAGARLQNQPVPPAKDKKDELIDNAIRLIDKFQIVCGNIFSIIDTSSLTNEQKVGNISNMSREIQEIRNYKKSLFEYKRGINTDTKVLDPSAYDEMAKGNTKELFANFNETKLPSKPERNPAV